MQRPVPMQVNSDPKEDVDTQEGDFDKPEEFMYRNTEHVYDAFVWLQDNYRTGHQSGNIQLIPLYEIEDEPYTLYFEEQVSK